MSVTFSNQDAYPSSGGELINFDAKSLITAAKELDSDFIKKYVADHANPDALNVRDERGFTPLHWVISGIINCSKEAGFECARILIESGADMNAQNNEQQGQETALGYVVRLVQAFDTPGNLENVDEWRKLIDLFVSHGATQAFSMDVERLKPTKKTVGWFNIDEATDGHENVRTKHVKQLKLSRERVDNHFWSQARLLSMGVADQSSPFSQLPQDVHNLIYKKIMY